MHENIIEFCIRRPQSYLLFNYTDKCSLTAFISADINTRSIWNLHLYWNFQFTKDINKMSNRNPQGCPLSNYVSKNSLSSFVVPFFSIFFSYFHLRKSCEKLKQVIEKIRHN